MKMGSDVTTRQESCERVSGDPAEMPEKSIASESVRTTAAASPTESEIATVAYQLWMENGCPVGSGHEDWFRAEAMLKNAFTPKGEEMSGVPSIPRCDTSTESEVLRQFRWRGHWEVWEMEWEGPRWVWD
jgi:hypothetical protein